MEKNKTTRQRLEERFPSDMQLLNAFPHDKFDTVPERASIYLAGDWMRSQCLAASEELIEKEREDTAIEFAEWIKSEGFEYNNDNTQHWFNKGFANAISKYHNMFFTTNELYKLFAIFLKGKEQ